MGLSEDEFREKAESALVELDQAFSRLANKHDLDADMAEGVLKVDFEEPEHSVFVISSNAPARQIWVSARLSSFKFDWREEGQRWVLHGSEESLREVLQRLSRDQLSDPSLTL